MLDEALQVKTLNSGIENPSFLVASGNGQFLYVVNEVNDYGNEQAGGVSAFRILKEGRLELINQVSSMGADPCHVVLDSRERVLLISNYSGGSLASVPVGPDGALGCVGSLIQHEGRGVDHRRQEGSHVHSAHLLEELSCCYVADLGIDQLVAYSLTADGELDKGSARSTFVAAGAGPRHMVINSTASCLYLINELDNTVNVFSIDTKGRLTSIQVCSSLPVDYEGFSSAADIHLSNNDRHLYVSNRGHDSITLFEVDKQSGEISRVDCWSTQGKHPRNFALSPDESQLLVANKDSDEIVVFDRNSISGRLQDTGKRVAVPSPVCLRYVRPPEDS